MSDDLVWRITAGLAGVGLLVVGWLRSSIKAVHGRVDSAEVRIQTVEREAATQAVEIHRHFATKDDLKDWGNRIIEEVRAHRPPV